MSVAQPLAITNGPQDDEPLRKVPAAALPDPPQLWQLEPSQISDELCTHVNMMYPERSEGLRADVVRQRTERDGANRVEGTGPSQQPTLPCNQLTEAAKIAEHSSEAVGSDCDSAFLSALPRGVLERFCLRLMDGAPRVGCNYTDLLPPAWREAVEVWRRSQRFQRCKEYTRPGASVDVTRQGKRQMVNSEDLVEGDMVHLVSGVVCPCDCVVLHIPQDSGPVVLSLSALCGVRTSLPRTVHRSKDKQTLSTNIIPSGALILSGSCVAVAIATGQRSAVGRLVSRASAVENPVLPYYISDADGDYNKNVSHVPGLAVNSRLCGALLPCVTSLVVEKDLLNCLMPSLHTVRVACAGHAFNLQQGPGRLPAEEALKCDEEGDEILRLCTGTHPPKFLLSATVGGDTSLAGRVGPLRRSDLLFRTLLAARLASDAVQSAPQCSVDPAVRAVVRFAESQRRLDDAAAEYYAPRGAYKYFAQLRLHSSLHVPKSRPGCTLLLLYGAARDVLTVCPVCLRAGGAVPLSAPARREVEEELSPERLCAPAARIVGFAAVEIGDHLLPSQARPIWDTLADIGSLVSQLSSACFLGAAVVSADDATAAAGAALRRIASAGISVHVVSVADCAAVRHAAQSADQNGVNCEVLEADEGRGGALFDTDAATAPSSVPGPTVRFHACVEAEGALKLVESLRAQDGVPCVCVSSLSMMPAARAALLSVSAVPEDGWWDAAEDRTERSSRVLIDGCDAAAYVRALCHMEISPEGLPLLADLLLSNRTGTSSAVADRVHSEHLCGSAAALRKSQ
eukprot:TRINITY_DN24957_c0_g1_i1.p1 TRINITY_DN24957_c0_g1~~TRINITY_DN24957_c0_g1_i1.p1  ORF type:complete len:817 (+),score=132.19 TRINITY_DN24957_c0_g1_i1:63-2453(+)